MLMVILSAPLCLLCFYLAWLCYRRAFYRQALVLGGFALVFLLFTLGMLGASYYTWEAMKLDHPTPVAGQTASADGTNGSLTFN